MGRDRSRSMSSTSSGRGVQSTSWDGQSGYRIHVSDLAAGIKRKEVERAFTKYGPINEVWVATNPPCFAFVNFKHRSDAEQAIRDADGKVVGSTRVGVTWARTRTYGSRNVGGRSGPLGSFRPSGGSGGGRRRSSRSRSRSGSRGRKRRYSRSRSRSRDRRRRRSESPREKKRSRRSSRDKDGKGKRDTSSSSSRSPSRSRSSSRKKSSKKVSRSPSSNRDDKANGSPVADGRSPVAVQDD